MWKFILVVVLLTHINIFEILEIAGGELLGLIRRGKAAELVYVMFWSWPGTRIGRTNIDIIEICSRYGRTPISQTFIQIHQHPSIYIWASTLGGDHMEQTIRWCGDIQIISASLREIVPFAFYVRGKDAFIPKKKVCLYVLDWILFHLTCTNHCQSALRFALCVRGKDAFITISFVCMC